MVEGILRDVIRSEDIDEDMAVDILTRHSNIFTSEGEVKRSGSGEMNLSKIAEQFIPPVLAVLDNLVNVGFKRERVKSALYESLHRTFQGIIRHSGNSAFRAFNESASGSKYFAIMYQRELEDAAMEYLCLTTEEKELPEVRLLPRLLVISIVALLVF